jgi:hypothetical protein
MKKVHLFTTLFVVLMSVSMAQNTIDNAYFEQVPYVGAFGDYDWTAGWSNFDPQSTVYPPTTITIPAGNISTDQVWSSGTSPVFNAASFSHSKLQDPFFTPTTYIGAFDGTNDWTAGWSNFNPQTTVYAPTTVTIPAGNITTNTTWTSNNVYLLNGWVYVKAGAKLTIQAGTVIRGDKVNKGTLIIEPGGQIEAIGTASQPIIFTSNQVAGSRTYGDWGGIIICGNATINVPGGTATIEGGVGTVYGGANDADNSGIMQYCRLEFPGIAFQPNNEINGLTMGGVGSGTTIDYIQVSYCGDDSFEWFGGTVNAKHLIALRGWDDDFDTDLGYRGKVQFAVSLRDPAVADVSSSNSFESDNDASGSGNTPFTAPVFSNVSVFLEPAGGLHPDYKRGMHLRRNTRCSVFNSVFTGFPTGLFIDGTNTRAAATAGDLVIENVIFAEMGTNFQSTFEQNYFNTPSRNNSTLTDSDALHLSDPFNLVGPNFQPQVGSNVYLLNGWVYVKSGATLTIRPGTIIRGDKVNKGALMIEPGGKIIAEGTPAAPIVFTSNQTAGSRTYGDWGGVIICGYAPINVPGGTATIEGGVGTVYGGSDENDNSGIMKYCRIEFSGIAFQPNNEINGLTMGGVGAGTTIENIQVSYCGDDSYEWFGGTVNAKYLIALRGWDDDFDTDLGYRGMVQFGVSLRDPAIADVSSSNSFESDNDGSGSGNTPITQPVFSNISTFLDPTATLHPDYKRALHLRRNTRTNVYNSIFVGFPIGLFIDGSAAQANATADILRMQNNLLVQTGTTYASSFEQNYFETPFRKNGTYSNYTDIMITNPFNLTNPNFMPLPGSPVLVRSYWTKEVSGQVTYNNTANTPLPNLTVTLNDGSKAVVASTMTNTSGDYKFDYVWKGGYTIEVTGAPYAFGGINTTDALVVRRHSIGIPPPLTGLKLEAADVNLSSSINTTDALLVRRRSINLPAATWLLPDWMYESFNVNLSDANIIQNILGLCSGDVNGSYTPAQ